MDADRLKALFTKPYGQPAPTESQWRELYDENVWFQDPTQERRGIEAYIDAQDGLMKRCDDLYLFPGAIAMDNNFAFIEWEMGLKIKGIEFIYPGASVWRSMLMERSSATGIILILLVPRLVQSRSLAVSSDGSTRNLWIDRP